MIAQDVRAERLDNFLLPYLFGSNERALSSGRGSRNVTFLRYLLMWLMRFAFQMEETALAKLFKKNRCSIADGCAAIENVRGSGNWAACLAEISEWVQKGETLHARLWAGMEQRKEEGSILEDAKGWKASLLGEAVFRAGMVYAQENPNEFDGEDVLDDDELQQAKEKKASGPADAEPKDAPKVRKAKALNRYDADKRRVEKIVSDSRTKEGRAIFNRLLGALQSAMIDPEVTKSLGPVLVSSTDCRAEDASTWATPALALRGNRPEVRITSKLGKHRLEKADSAITQALKRIGFAAMSFGVFQSPGRANTFSTLYKLTEIEPNVRFA